MLVSGLLSFFVTHRFAGPLYRFQQVTERIAAGDLSIRVKLRKGDDLLELEEAMNRALAVLEENIHEAQRLQRDLVGRLEALNQQGSLRREDLTGLLDTAQRMGTVLGRLRVSGE
jgi:methyl-accepting chemotaxis protein